MFQVFRLDKNSSRLWLSFFLAYSDQSRINLTQTVELGFQGFQNFQTSIHLNSSNLNILWARYFSSPLFSINAKILFERDRGLLIVPLASREILKLQQVKCSKNVFFCPFSIFFTVLLLLSWNSRWLFCEHFWKLSVFIAESFSFHYRKEAFHSFLPSTSLTIVFAESEQKLTLQRFVNSTIIEDKGSINWEVKGSISWTL